MYLKLLFLAFVGLSAGLMISGGVFTVFVSVGLVPCFADKTHTGSKILFYESCIACGTIAGCIISIYGKALPIGRVMESVVSQDVWNFLGNLLLVVSGTFAGMFVGCFAIAIAEMLNTIPIFTRRINLGKGLGIAILSIAFGKTAGSLFYFIQKIFQTGGV